MYDALMDWIKEILPDYVVSRGQWVEHSSIHGRFVCAVLQNGGPKIDVEVRRPRYKLILLGPRNGREHTGKVQDDAELIQQATMDREPPCGAVILWTAGEPVGPGFTSENRPWVQVDLQMTY